MADNYFEELLCIFNLDEDYKELVNKYYSDYEKYILNSVYDRKKPISKQKEAFILYNLIYNKTNKRNFKKAYKILEDSDEYSDLLRLIKYGEKNNVYLPLIQNKLDGKNIPFKKTIIGVLFTVLASLPPFAFYGDDILKTILNKKDTTMEDNDIKNKQNEVNRDFSTIVKESEKVELIPSKTQVPTNTFVPTSTPVPTSTFVPTSTPVPTSTFVPINTQQPIDNISTPIPVTNSNNSDTDLPTIDIENNEENYTIVDMGDAEIVSNGEVLNANNYNDGGELQNNKLNKRVERLSLHDSKLKAILETLKKMYEALLNYGSNQIPPKLKEKAAALCKKVREKYIDNKDVKFSIGDEKLRGEIEFYIKKIEDVLEIGKEVYIGNDSNGIGSKFWIDVGKECSSFAIKELIKVNEKEYSYENKHTFSVNDSKEQKRIK